MGFALRRGISFCDAGGRLIFLDVEKDRYFCLSDQAEHEFRGVVAGETAALQDDAGLSTLLSSGLLVAADGPIRPEPCPAPPVPQRSLADEARTPSAGQTIVALAGLAASRIALKLLPLPLLVRRLERRKARADRPRTEQEPPLAEIAAGFRQAALIASPLDQCLSRSFAIAHALLRRDMNPIFVIGVRLNPFRAHCWVQAGTILISDSLDEVRNFTPVLVI